MIPGGVNPMLLSAGGSGYQVSRSLRLRASASGFIRRVPSVTGSRRRFAIRSLVKRGALGAQMMLFQATLDGSNFTRLFFDSSNRLQLLDYHPGGAGGVNIDVISTAVFRDPTAWIDILLSYDLANASAAKRWEIWVNGVQLTSFTVGVLPAQNSVAGGWNLAGVNHDVGSLGGTNNLDGCIAGLHWLDDIAPAPTVFGGFDVSGNWRPKAYSGTYGAQGSQPDFSDPTSLTTLMLDRSGNGNNWTANNISLTAGATYDSMLDVPLGGGGNERGNYCTWNPLDSLTNKPTQGNLRAVHNPNEATKGTQFRSSGKWYFEFVYEILGVGADIGIGKPTAARGQYPGFDANGYGYSPGTGNKGHAGSGTAYGSASAVGDIISVAYDLDNGKIWWSKNGTWHASGDPAAGTNAAFTGLSGEFAPMFGISNVGSGAAGHINCGQRPFAYAPPAGFKALHTGNLTSDTVTVSGSFTGNAIADGPAIWMNGAPETLTINGNAVTWGTHADKTAGGFKLRTSSTSYNSSGTNTWTATVLTPSSNSAFRKQLAKTN
jgi:hypothetical protein